MSNTAWYVRLGDQILGPISDPELRDLALRGGVKAQTPVSLDKTNWIEAAAVSGIVFGAIPPRTPQVTSSVAATPAPGGQFNPAWLLVGILLGGVGMLVCGCLVLIVIGALAGPGEPDGGPPVENVAPPALTREQILAQRTYNYWTEIGTATASVGQAGNRTPQATVAALRRAASQVRALPTADADPDAVQCGNDVATVLVNLADVIEQSNNPGTLVEAFLRGAAGDPFGTTADLLDAQSAISQQLKQVQAELDNARSILSSRYKVEFPPL